MPDIQPSGLLLASGGITPFPASALPADGASLAALLRELYDQAEKVAQKAAAVITNGLTLFTIANGSIEIEDLFAYCVTPNNATASTVQIQSNPTVGSAKAISGASASLASATAGTGLFLNNSTLATAMDIVTAANGGVAIQANVGNRIIVHAGTLSAVVGVGSTTGTWAWALRYKPLGRGITVT